MVDPFIIKRDAHALRVLFRRYLRSRGFNPCSRESGLESETGVTPEAPIGFLIFLEWLWECPDIRPRVEFVERHYVAAVAEIHARREARQRR